jgi:hypothetical protein
MSGAGPFEELGDPAAADDEGFGRFQEGHNGRCGEGGDVVGSAEEPLAKRDESGRGGTFPPDRLADAEQIFEDILDGLGLETEDPGGGIEAADRRLEGVEVDRGEVWWVLHQNQIGAEPDQTLNIERIE